MPFTAAVTRRASFNILTLRAAAWQSSRPGRQNANEPQGRPERYAKYGLTGPQKPLNCIYMKKKTFEIHTLMTTILFGMLILSFIYGTGGIVFSTAGKMAFFDRSRMEYAKITLQCILGLTVLFLPAALEHRFKITFSNEMHILFVLFLYGAIILGEVQGYYKKFFHWDTLLHTLSGVMLSSFGFCIIDIINKSEKVNLALSDLFMAFFSFCFAVTLGAIWEIVEFMMDVVMDLNMQQYNLPDGTVLTGHYAVVDTMKDLIVDTLGALLISVIGYILLKRQKSASVKK